MLKYVTFIEGLLGILKQSKEVSLIELENGFLILNDGTQIPFHRIIKIEYNDKPLYIR
jgi:hypothetical protein